MTSSFRKKYTNNDSSARQTLILSIKDEMKYIHDKSQLQTAPNKKSVKDSIKFIANIISAKYKNRRKIHHLSKTVKENLYKKYYLEPGFYYKKVITDILNKTKTALTLNYIESLLINDGTEYLEKMYNYSDIIIKTSHFSDYYAHNVIFLPNNFKLKYEKIYIISNYNLKQKLINNYLLQGNDTSNTHNYNLFKNGYKETFRANDSFSEFFNSEICQEILEAQGNINNKQFNITKSFFNKERSITTKNNLTRKISNLTAFNSPGKTINNDNEFNELDKLIDTLENACDPKIIEKLNKNNHKSVSKHKLAEMQKLIVSNVNKDKSQEDDDLNNNIIIIDKSNESISEKSYKEQAFESPTIKESNISRKSKFNNNKKIFNFDEEENESSGKSIVNKYSTSTLQKNNKPTKRLNTATNLSSNFNLSHKNSPKSTKRLRTIHEKEDNFTVIKRNTGIVQYHSRDNSKNSSIYSKKLTSKNLANKNLSTFIFSIMNNKQNTEATPILKPKVSNPIMRVRVIQAKEEEEKKENEGFNIFSNYEKTFDSINSDIPSNRENKKTIDEYHDSTRLNIASSSIVVSSPIKKQIKYSFSNKDLLKLEDNQVRDDIAKANRIIRKEQVRKTLIDIFYKNKDNQLSKSNILNKSPDRKTFKAQDNSSFNLESYFTHKRKNEIKMMSKLHNPYVTNYKKSLLNINENHEYFKDKLKSQEVKNKQSNTQVFIEDGYFNTGKLNASVNSSMNSTDLNIVKESESNSSLKIKHYEFNNLNSIDALDHIRNNPKFSNLKIFHNLITKKEVVLNDRKSTFAKEKKIENKINSIKKRNNYISKIRKSVKFNDKKALLPLLTQISVDPVKPSASMFSKEKKSENNVSNRNIDISKCLVISNTFGENCSNSQSYLKNSNVINLKKNKFYKGKLQKPIYPLNLTSASFVTATASYIIG